MSMRMLIDARHPEETRVAVVKGTPHPVQAEQFITGLLHGEGSAALLADGFLPPPLT